MKTHQARSRRTDGMLRQEKHVPAPLLLPAFPPRLECMRLSTDDIRNSKYYLKLHIFNDSFNSVFLKETP